MLYHCYVKPSPIYSRSTFVGLSSLKCIFKDKLTWLIQITDELLRLNISLDPVSQHYEYKPQHSAHTH